MLTRLQNPEEFMVSSDKYDDIHSNFYMLHVTRIESSGPIKCKSSVNNDLFVKNQARRIEWNDFH